MLVEDLLRRLDGSRKVKNGWESFCPAHDDKKRRSLSVSVGKDDKILLHCFAGCATSDVLQKIGLQMTDLNPEERQSKKRVLERYDYTDEIGKLLFQVERLDPKGFRQRRPDGKGGYEYKLNGVRKVLYRLPELVKADTSSPVFVVEGEKDADRLRELGLLATTNAGGAGKWDPEYAKYLEGRTVYVLPDADEPGKRHAKDVAVSLKGAAATIKIVELPGVPAKGDVSDWLGKDGTADALLTLASNTPDWNPETDSSSPLSVGKTWPGVLEELRRRKAGGYHPVPTGIVSLDSLLGGGFPRGQTSIGAAPPGRGKSSLALDVCLSYSRANHPALFWTLELTKEDVHSRLVCLDHNPSKPWHEVRAGNELEAAETVAGQHAGIPLYILDGADCSDVSSLNSAIDIIKSIHKESPFVVVDYVQLLADPAAAKDPRLAAETVARDLLEVAKKTDSALLLLSSVSRTSYQVNKGAAVDLTKVLGMAKESGRLESDAAVVFGIVPVGAEDQDPRDRRGWIAVAKNRLGGGIGKVAVSYDGLSGRFTEIATDKVPAGRAKDYIKLIIEAVGNAESRGEPISNVKDLRLHIAAGMPQTQDALSTCLRNGVISKDESGRYKLSKTARGDA